jgi:glycosyltransferase involved in cell wall biosynthesis
MYSRGGRYLDHRRRDRQGAEISTRVTAPSDRIRLLVLSPIPEEGAGCRFRIAQFIPHLESAGVDVTLRPLYTREFFRLVYKHGHYARKGLTFAQLVLRQLSSLRDISQFDVVFIYREVFPIGPPIVERLLARRGRPPIVFDFDDAIFLPSVSDANRVIGALKYPGKVSSIIRGSAHVIAGNEYLAAYARQFSDAVTVLPTCVDTSRFIPAAHRLGANGSGRIPVIGWIGSPTTSLYIRQLAPALRRVSEQQDFVLRVSGAGEPIAIDGVAVEDIPWTLEGEIGLFNSCDIGVYPLADDEWSKGKCGFKAIEFMACGVPVVAAAVGVNREIIQDGVNGFLAATDDEWVEKIRRLLTDSELRRRFAAAGRQTVEERYSLQVNAPRLAAAIRAVAERSTRNGGRH